jgi:hypothetical protein
VLGAVRAPPEGQAHLFHSEQQALAYLMKEAISRNERHSEAIRASSRLSRTAARGNEAIRGNQRPSEPIRAYQSQSARGLW